MEEATRHYRRKQSRKTLLGRFTRFLSLVFLVITVAFIGILSYSQFLTYKMLGIAVAVILILFVLIFPALYSFRFKRSRKIICSFLAIVVGGALALAGVYIFDTLLFFNKVTADPSGKDSAQAKSVDVTEESFNVLITGIDVEGDISQKSRSDVNMIVTINPRSRKILLTSIPRDFYVEYPDVPGEFDKLTHSGIYGADETVAVVENLTGLDMNYYAKVNYSTVKSLVDSIGGIDVNSDYRFETHGQAYYLFEEGFNHLNGEEALAFARERKAFEDGDFQRNKDQQKVMKAVLKKMTSPKVLILKYPDILKAIKNYMELNMNSSDIKALIRMQTSDLSGWKISSQNMAGETDLRPCYALGGEFASVVVPDEGSVNSSIEKIKQIMFE